MKFMKNCILCSVFCLLITGCEETAVKTKAASIENIRYKMPAKWVAQYGDSDDSQVHYDIWLLSQIIQKQAAELAKLKIAAEPNEVKNAETEVQNN